MSTQGNIEKEIFEKASKVDANSQDEWAEKVRVIREEVTKRLKVKPVNVSSITPMIDKSIRLE